MKQQANIAQVHTTRNKTKQNLHCKTKQRLTKRNTETLSINKKQTKTKTNERSCKTETIKP